MKNILIVGAGAVGQVYGYAFSKAGFNVTFLIKEKYQNELNAGLTLYDLNQDKNRNNPIRFNQYSTIFNWNEAKEIANSTPWDQIYLCISSTALANFDFSGMKEAISDSTIIAMMQPGPKDYELAASHFPTTQIVQGMITLISYTTPMSTETNTEPGIAYWLPPMTPTPFSGETKQRDELIRTFKKAGMRAKADNQLLTKAPFPTAALMCILTALEAKDWKFQALKHDKAMLNAIIKAIDTSFHALSKENEQVIPLWKHLITPTLLKTLIMIAPKVLPMDIEKYLETHFMKVKDQTKLFMKTYIETAQAHELDAQPVIALNQLTG